MDDTIRNPTDGRQQSADRSDHDSPAARGSEGEGTRSADIVTICAWCPQLHILSLQRRDVDVIVTVQFGKTLKIIRNGVELQISDGICNPCRDRLKKS